MHGPVDILLTTLGSAGDVYPFIRLGLALQERGHRATLITNPHFEGSARRAGLDFIPLGALDFYEMLTSNPDVWHPSKGPVLIGKLGLPLVLRPLYDILSQFDPTRAIVVGSSAAIAGRIMHEQCGMPLVTVFNQPAYLYSLHQTPKMSSVPWLDSAPRFIKRWMFGQITRFLDKLFGPQVNAFRAEIGLSTLASPAGWFNSPQRIIGLFPQWYAPQQPDWPPQTRLTGFTLYDGSTSASAESSLPDDLQAFLNAGSSPIVFSLGTAMRQSRNFFAESIEACRLLGRRGVLVTQYRDQVPEPLPEGIIHASYAPFGALFPRAAALVYNGGVGTLAQAVAAGIPHLVVPMSHDQPDNAARIKRFGLGATIPFKDYRAALAARKLAALLDSAVIRERCRVYMGKVNADDSVRDTCDLIEEFLPVETA